MRIVQVNTRFIIGGDAKYMLNPTAILDVLPLFVPHSKLVQVDKNG